MASENFKLAVLNVLAASAEGSATLDELRRDVPIILADEDETEQLRRFSALGDIDIFQSGLLLRNDTGFEITGVGLSLLQSLAERNTKARTMYLEAMAEWIHQAGMGALGQLRGGGIVAGARHSRS